VLAATALCAAPASAALSDLWPFGKPTPSETIPNPLPYKVTFSAPGAGWGLARSLRQASELVNRQKNPASGLVGLLARARQDLTSLTAVLYEDARYAGEVAITVDGQPLANVDPFATVNTSPVPVTITVTPGPQFVFGQVSATPLPPGLTLEALGLTPGAPARSSIVVAAEAKLVGAWKDQGHPLVAAVPRATVADHRTNTLDVALAVRPGPQANFGRVTVSGTEQVDPTLVLRRAGIDGGLYSQKIVKRAAKRLRDLGVFASVDVSPATRLDPDGTMPVAITVSERKPRVIGGSVTYSNTEGLGLEVHWGHRNLFGGGEQLRLSASVGRLLDGAFDPDYRLAGTFRKPAVLDPMTDFTLSVDGYRQTTNAYRVTALESEAGLEHAFSDVLSGSVALQVARSLTVEPTLTQDHLLTTLTGKLDWDTRDNKFDPSSGYHVLMSAAPAYDFLESTPYATFSADAAGYWAFGSSDRFVLAARAAASVLTVDDVTKVAADRRLYSGGAGSVRGYAYQNIGPRDGSGNLVGGRSSILFSGELRYRVTDTIGLVAFVDAGSAYSSMIPSFGGLKVGVGAGLRYLTPVGPIRLDVAVPLQPGPGDPSVGVYVGLGQAF
jgi:translocation and assembly module TamA